MLARLRTQSRLLLFASVAIAALAIPGIAAAAPATLDIESAHLTGPDEGMTFTSPDEEAHYEYAVTNNDTSNPLEASANTRIVLEYATAELELSLVQADGAIDCTTVDTAGTTEATCPIEDIAAGDGVVLIVDMALADGFTGPTTTLSVTASADGTSDTLVDTSDWDYAPTCTDGGFYYGTTFTRAELQADGTVSIPIACTDPDGGALTITPEAGTNGTMTGSGSSATFTASAATLARPTGFFEFFELELSDDEGDTTVANVQVSVLTQSDLASTLTGPTSFAVPAAGGTVTYTNTVRNNGPDALGQLGFGWIHSDTATLVSATVNGAAVTCRRAEFGSEGIVPVGCGTTAMPAVGATAVGTITLRFAAGEKGLKLPAAAPIVANAFPDSTTGAEDRRTADNSNTLTTALAAFVQPVAPTNPTQGTSGPDTYVGTSGNDTFSGGAGNDSFRGAAGDDLFYGGAGDDVFDGGAGADRFYGGTGDESGFGGLGGDTMFGGLGNDRLVGGDGTDKLYGQAGRDRLLGSTGSDVVNGGSGNDVVRGGTGADVLFCGAGNDIATGDNGTDLLGCRDGKPGDTLSGGNGRDTCIGDVGDRYLGCERIIRLA